MKELLRIDSLEPLTPSSDGVVCAGVGRSQVSGVAYSYYSYWWCSDH